jgi:hypothetical protein
LLSFQGLFRKKDTTEGVSTYLNCLIKFVRSRLDPILNETIRTRGHWIPDQRTKPSHTHDQPRSLIPRSTIEIEHGRRGSPILISIASDVSNGQDPIVFSCRTLDGGVEPLHGGAIADGAAWRALPLDRSRPMVEVQLR